MDELELLRAEIDRVDEQTASLFCRRMEISQRIAACKAERGLPITDEKREREVLSKNETRVPEELRPLYRVFLRRQMELSKRRQSALLGGNSDGTVLRMELTDASYPIYFCRGGIRSAGKRFPLDRKVMVVTDSGVPAQYAKTVAEQCRDAKVFTFPAGEENKSFATLEALLLAMQEAKMSRTDAVVSVGGGVAGDLAGLAASLFMRGIDFYNIPTTLLSQVDSSVGGKTAVDLAGVKNAAGTFHQPRGVLIDPSLLSTLPPERMADGFAEALKMATLFDPELFRVFEEGRMEEELDTVILRSVMIKKRIVEADEHESGLRRTLNFGHTLGHGLEAAQADAGTAPLSHGMCVAVGMLPVASAEVRARLLPILRRLSLPTAPNVPTDAAFRAVCHDKKRDGDLLSVVFAPAVGSYEIRKIPQYEFEKIVRSCFGEENR